MELLEEIHGRVVVVVTLVEDVDVATVVKRRFCCARSNRNCGHRPPHQMQTSPPFGRAGAIGVF
jgi:hypothetical protein